MRGNAQPTEVAAAGQNMNPLTCTIVLAAAITLSTRAFSSILSTLFSFFAAATACAIRMANTSYFGDVIYACD